MRKHRIHVHMEGNWQRLVKGKKEREEVGEEKQAMKTLSI